MGADLGSDVACTLGRPEVSNFGPFRVNAVLTPEDLEIIRLKYQVPVESG